MSCLKCRINLLDAIIKFGDEDSSIQFLLDHLAIIQEMKCTSCKNFCKFNIKKLMWRWQKQFICTKIKKK